jgi:hypothetical protein
LVTGRGSGDLTVWSDDGKDHAARGIGPYESIGPGLEEICGVGSDARGRDHEDDTWKKLQLYPLHPCSLQNLITSSRICLLPWRIAALVTVHEDRGIVLPRAAAICPTIAEERSVQPMGRGGDVLDEAGGRSSRSRSER